MNCKMKQTSYTATLTLKKLNNEKGTITFKCTINKKKCRGTTKKNSHWKGTIPFTQSMKRIWKSMTRKIFAVINIIKPVRHTCPLHFWPPEDLLKSHQQGEQTHLQYLILPSSVAGPGYPIKDKRTINKITDEKISI